MIDTTYEYFILDIVCLSRNWDSFGIRKFLCSFVGIIEIPDESQFLKYTRA